MPAQGLGLPVGAGTWRGNWSCGGDTLGKLQISSHCQTPKPEREKKHCGFCSFGSQSPARGFHGRNRLGASRPGAWCSGAELRKGQHAGRASTDDYWSHCEYLYF